MRRIGIDIGSTFTKYCVMDGAQGTKKLSTERTPVQQKPYFADKFEKLHAEYGECPIITCGYGRKNISSDKTVSELTALAAGADRECQGIPVVLDIGGQDTKVICQENGKLKAFFLNEKCAAGCGLFLGNVLHLLQMDFQQIDLRDIQEPRLHLSSTCAVFAQSEIVELLADGITGETIIYAVLTQILIQAKVLLGKVDISTLILSGGLTRISGIRAFAERILEKKVVIPEYAAYLSAIGCAMQ